MKNTLALIFLLLAIFLFSACQKSTFETVEQENYLLSKDKKTAHCISSERSFPFMSKAVFVGYSLTPYCFRRQRHLPSCPIRGLQRRSRRSQSSG